MPFIVGEDIRRGFCHKIFPGRKNNYPSKTHYGAGAGKRKGLTKGSFFDKKKRERKDIFNGVVAQGRTEHWYHIPQAHDPDKDYLCWIYNWGDFSIRKAEAFDRHLERINRLNKFYSHLNGKRIRTVIDNAGLFYGRRGLEGII